MQVNTKKILWSFGSVTGATVIFLLMSWLIFVPSSGQPEYEFVTAWGEKGSGPGQFSDPIGIAVSHDEVFVSDARNARIQVFDFNGNYRRQFGIAGDGPGQLGRPMNLTIANDELYVADYFNDRIEVFALDGTHLRGFGTAGSGPGQFNAPGGVAVTEQGEMIIADFYNARIQLLDKRGNPVRQWGTTGKVGIRSGEFNYPTDIAVTREGTIYVADGYNDRVQVFDQSGDFSHKWGGPFATNIKGSFNGWFRTISSIAVGADDRVFVTDFYNHRVQVFQTDGTFLYTMGTQGTGPGQLTLPVGIEIAEDGTLFIVDHGNNRIQKWSLLKPEN
jgi:DNA-binding beta-propeller fold protein YncE